jgi:hypothetical protein
MKRALATLVGLCACSPGRIEPPPGPEPALVPADSWCVTLGSVRNDNGQRFVDSEEMRAVTAAATEPAAEVRFTYLGPTATSSMLASGMVFRQIGLKLLAADSCNVLYVMWRLDPDPGLVVMLKRNPGKTLGSECGDQGYRTVRPRASLPLPEMAVGAPHVLRAALVAGELTVRVDGEVVWRGAAPPEAAELQGPVGVRTDNGRFSLDLWAPAGATTTGPCPRGGRD